MPLLFFYPLLPILCLKTPKEASGKTRKENPNQTVRMGSVMREEGGKFLLDCIPRVQNST